MKEIKVVDMRVIQEDNVMGFRLLNFKNQKFNIRQYKNTKAVVFGEYVCEDKGVLMLGCEMEDGSQFLIQESGVIYVN